MTLLQVVAGFLLGAGAIVAAGTVLARNADVIAARTSLGGLWAGSVLLAVATSLPELSTDISAVRLGALDLAAGDLFGSSMANMLILAVVSLASPTGELFRRMAFDHVLYAALAIVLTCTAAAFVLLGTLPGMLRVGPGSALLVAIYIVGSRAIYRHGVLAKAAGTTVEMGAGPAGEASISAPAAEDAGPDVLESADPTALPTLRHAVLRFTGATLVILVAGPVFAVSAHRLAGLTGLGEGFVGTWLVGLSTSLPELATSLAAVRMRRYDLAAGNLFGSNALNMSLFVALDLASREGPVLGAVGESHVVSALVATALMATGLAAVMLRTKARFALLEPSSLGMLLMYATGLAAVYVAGIR